MIVLRPDPRGPLRIFKMPDAKRSYTIGADAASGRAALDYAAAAGVDDDTGEHVFSYKAHVEPADFGDQLLVLGTLFKGRNAQALMVPEINNHGLVTVNRLRAIGYTRIYTRQIWDTIEAKMGSQVGWQTSVKSRPMLINRARNALADGRCLIPDIELLDEAATFVLTDEGKEEHQPGCHDDLLFAWMLALEGRAMSFGGGDLSQEPVAETKPHPWGWIQQKLEQVAEEALEQTRGVVGFEDDSWDF